MREFLTKDLGWKLFSLALAFAVWLTVKAVSHDARAPGLVPNSPWTTRTFKQLPVLAVSAAADVRAFEVKPVAVDVTIGGRPELIYSLTGKELKVTVDLTTVEAARDLRKRVDVSAPPGVALVLADPDSVDVVVPPRDKD